ncbi:Capsular polysaccharide ABC transporter, ATP-binding protein KpsT [Candidatus Rhodobacter oscarellae]|uniref:Capsular polysaccharide ABC transporter, ATP-binding protein KpsT n=1 Tax=Candidatus Rhodobacter oscarellae TaxID=1675527 RepID=A0A0J9EDM5_9RHOB|nr:ABC transporter ATP-binding protein [Candidatus Rhodobacter lobularis]KMW59834.1 Capsular polysaccharide ABC transporter, ATP-binding protein KpsT [Candidatus Rhodobacter lobularis]
MIRLQNLTKIFVLNGRRNVVADNITVDIPTGAAVGLLGRNGAGKSTLMNMIAGNVAPTSGEILSTGTISYPVGFSGSFHGELTGAQNTRFLARIYGIDTDSLCDFVEDFSELGKHFHLPFRSYSSGMRSRLAFGVSMGIPFDTYLVDEVTSVGDAAFRKKSSAVFLDRMQRSGALFVSHSMPMVKELCDMGAVIEDGKLTIYDDVDEAIAVHEENMGVGS